MPKFMVAVDLETILVILGTRRVHCRAPHTFTPKGQFSMVIPAYLHIFEQKEETGK